RVVDSTGRYVVPTGRVVVSTGRYVVLTGRVVVPTGRYVVPTSRVVVPTGRYVVSTGRVVVPTCRVVVPTDRVPRKLCQNGTDEQKNLYKALVDAYEADKTILDSYRETVILKRRRDDDDDQDEGPSVGSDQGSKRRRDGKEPESASAPLETATRSAGRSTRMSKSRQVSASESAFVEEPPKKPLTLDRDWKKTLPAVQGSTQTWISKLAKQADSRSSFNELLDTPLNFFNFIMNRLKVDTLTLKILAGPTFELLKGSCTSLIELEYHLEEVYKATM
nr:hypothetical protein [Tanacetum cinerariifolium]